MRHQPSVARKRIEQAGIGFDRSIDGAQPLELRHVFEIWLTSVPSLGALEDWLARDRRR